MKEFNPSDDLKKKINNGWMPPHTSLFLKKIYWIELDTMMKILRYHLIMIL